MWYLLAMPSVAPEPKLQIALTLPGGITSGAFEAGAICALVGWIQEVNRRSPDAAEIDVITGASAGALTSLLAARALLGGDDPVSAFRRAWVIEPTLRALRGKGLWAPLSLQRARMVARDLLLAQSGLAAGYRQKTPITVDMPLACLRGFTEEPGAENALLGPDLTPATTRYLDWSTRTLGAIPPGAPPTGVEAEAWQSIIESAIASASHPVAFPATLLDRSALRSEYEAAGAMNLPDAEDLQLWYSDGGLLDNEPLAQCLTHVRAAPSTTARLLIVVRSHMHYPPESTDPAWTGAIRPRWTATLWRTLDLLITHSVTHDLSHAERINTRIGSIGDVANKLAELLGDTDDVRGELRLLQTAIEGEPEPTGAPLQTAATSRSGDKASKELIREILYSASGLAAKQHVQLAFFGPLVGNELIGVIDRRAREAHFKEGYSKMLTWIEGVPSFEQRLGIGLVRDAYTAADRKLQDSPARHAGTRPSRPTALRRDVQLWELGQRVAQVAVGDFIAHRRVRARRPAAPRRRQL